MDSFAPVSRLAGGSVGSFARPATLNNLLGNRRNGRIGFVRAPHPLKPYDQLPK
jgi:hypothetical protein